MLIRLRQFVLCFGIVLAAQGAFGQSNVLGIGDVQLRLGTPRATVKTLLEKYKLNPFGSDSYGITSYDAGKKEYISLGSVGFENGQLSWISRDIDTSGWPNDEGYAMARAITDTISSSIPLTDRDGAKRATIKVVTSNQDGTAGNTPLNLRITDFYIDEKKVSVLVSDDARNGKSVSVTISIRTKPWALGYTK